VIIKAKRLCPVCNNESVKIIKNISIDIPESFNLPKSYDVVCCDKCGFCYANTDANENQYEYYYKNHNTYTDSSQVELAGQEEFKNVKDTIKQFLNFDSKIVDIGCGSGLFEVELFSDGYKNITGIDPSKSSVDKLLNKGIKAFVGSIYDEPTEDVRDSFDGVFLIAVMEHLLDPKKAIEKIKKYINKNGKIFICVPDYSKMDINLTPQPNNFNQEHINYFSRKSLNNLLNLYGFKETYSIPITYKYVGFEEFTFLSVYSYKRDNNFILEKDEGTESALSDYFQREDEKSSLCAANIEDLVKSAEKIIVWGTGAFTMSLLATTRLKECNIIAYVDNNPLKIGDDFKGKKIIAPSSIKSSHGTIIICSMLYSNTILEQIKSMNLTNKVIVFK